MWFKHSILIPQCNRIFKPSFKHSHHNHHHSESSLLVIHCLVSPGFGLVSLYYHYHYHSGSSLLSQSGFRPAITLLSASLSFWVITALSVRVSACPSLSHLHHYHSWYCIHCLVSPGLGLLYALSIPLVVIKLIKYITLFIHSRLLFYPCTVKDRPSVHYSSSILTLIQINNI